ncbi:MAG: UbiA family prenyltransferase [Candidatus Hodarchaeales archaeon]|jgi:4-hydroxybenzoate polyprenyltransferase
MMDSTSTQTSITIFTKDIMALTRITLCVLSSIALFISGYCIYRWNLLVEDNVTIANISFINFFLNNSILPLEGVVLGLFVPFLLIAGTHTINDYYDYSSDVANQRLDRPLVKGLITPQFARTMAVLIYLAVFTITTVIVILYNISIWLIPTVVLFIFMGVFYNLGVKNYGIIGNIWVSVGYVAPFAMAAFLLGFASQWVLINFILTSCFIFFLALGREILKDIMDIEGDLATGKKSIPIVLGKTRAVWVSSAVYLFSILCGISLVFLGFKENYVFVIGFLLVSGLISYTLGMMLRDPSIKNAITARKYTRWTLWWSTALIFLSSLFIH